MILLGIWSAVGLAVWLGQREDWGYGPKWKQRLVFFAYGPVAWGLILLILGVAWVVTRSAYRASPEVREDSPRSVRETSRTVEMPE